MVGEDMKIMSFQEVSEMFDGEVDSEQFPIKSAVSGLSWCHLLGDAMHHCTYCCVRGVRHKTCWCIRFRIG